MNFAAGNVLKDNPLVTSYPGECASSGQLSQLASKYRDAAMQLTLQGRKGDPLSRAPCRLVALHAIELYLNSFLLAAGQDSRTIRGLQHNLSARSVLAVQSGLVLRKRTAAHLAKLSDDREYLVTRYGPELTATLSQINRLIATLEELATKVPVAIAKLQASIGE